MPVILIGAHGHAQTVLTLEPGVPATATISDGEVHRYASSVAGEIRVVVENLERGILLTACRPDCSRNEYRITRSATWRGPEHFHVAVFTADEQVVIELTPDTSIGPSGDYRITLQRISADSPEYLAELAMSHGLDLHAGYWWDGADTRRKALNRFRLAAFIFALSGNRARAADALFEGASVHLDLDNYNKAHRALLIAEDIWLVLGDWDAIAASRNLRGLIQLNFGDQLTDQRSERAIDLFESVVDTRSEADDAYFRGQALNNLSLAYRRQGNWRLSLRYSQDALQALSGNVELLSVDPANVDFSAIAGGPWLDDALTALTSIGLAHYQSADSGQAIRHYEQALKLARFLDTRRLAAEIHSNLGAIYYGTGMLDRALDHLLEALPYFRDVSRDARWESEVYNNLGLVYYASGDAVNAKIALLEARNQRSRERDPLGRAETLRHLVSLDLDIGDIDSALTRIDEAFSLIPMDQENAIELAATHSLAGSVHLAAGNVEEALRHHDDATRLLVGNAGMARALSDRAWALHIAGRDVLALAELQVALEVAEETNSVPDLVRANTLLAEIHAANAEAAQAEFHASAAVSLSNEIRAQIRHPALLREFTSVQRDAYDVLVRSKILQQDHASAWTLADGARARRFRELLGRSDADVSRLSSDELSRFEELSLKVGELGQLRTELLAAERDLEADDVRRELLPLTVELQSLQLKTEDAADTADPQFSPADIQSRLGARDLLLEFHFARDWAGVWTVRQDSLDYHELSSLAELENLVESFRESLGPVGSTSDTSLRRLSQILFADSGIRFSDSERIIVVPDGPLHFVPVSALIDPDNGLDQPILATREVDYLPSASSLLALEARRQGRGTGLAILADPVFEPDDERVQSLNEAASDPVLARLEPSLGAGSVAREHGGFGRLFYTAREADAIRESAADIDVLVATGIDANLDFVLNGSLNRFRYLHFATHGVLDVEEPDSSGLVLAGVTADGSRRRRYLRTSDIVTLDLQADLVVLSGCDTGLGKPVRGEGLLSLSRAFMHAGANTVVSSLWQVPDAATAQLMSAFYREMLGNSKPPAEALRLAQLEIRSDARWQNPYYWAAFVVQGTWQTPQA